MVLRLKKFSFGFGFGVAVTALAWTICGSPILAQAPAASTATSQAGTVKSVTGETLMLTTDAGQSYTVTIAPTARLVQLPVGSKDLKTATPIMLPDIAAGDRVLVSGKPGDAPAALTATRVILMKSADIAQLRAAEQADWQKRGTGGLVSAVDASSGTITVTVGTKKLLVDTTPKTVFRRYAGDSVKFEDAKLGTIAQVQPGDQMRVRGAKSDDGLSLDAEEIVSGSFKNLAGVVATIDPAGGTLTLKDLTTKKVMTVAVTANSDVRALPAQAAAMFAARAKGGAGGPGGAGGGSYARPSGADSAASGPGGAAGGPGGTGRTRGAGMDLSQMITRLPEGKLADLKAGDAVMIVASEPTPGATSVTAVTLLSGVEPILAATPTGSPAMTLSPWSMGGGGGGEGGGPE